jgi:hypothetical protein
LLLSTFSAPKLSHFVAVAAGGIAAPLSLVIFRRVVEYQNAGARIGATPEILEIGGGQKPCNLCYFKCLVT